MIPPPKTTTIEALTEIINGLIEQGYKEEKESGSFQHSDYEMIPFGNEDEANTCVNQMLSLHQLLYCLAQDSEGYLLTLTFTVGVIGRIIIRSFMLGLLKSTKRRWRNSRMSILMRLPFWKEKRQREDILKSTF